MKIAIIGSGHIGGGLGRAWAKKRHEIVFGARDAKEADLVALCKEIGASAADIATACSGAEVVVFAMPFGAIDDVLRAAGDLAGKVVIDCTNAVEWATKSLKYGHTTSAAEELQKKIPAAHVFKSFNAQGAENLANPVYNGVAASNFFCGNDAEAKKKVKQLVEDVGFEGIDAGGLQAARLIEPMMMLWIAASQSVGSRDIAFKILKR